MTVRWILQMKWILGFGSLVLALLAVFPAIAADPSSQVSILDEALSKLDTTRADLQIPEPWESGYITAARLPAIIDALANPLYTAPFMQVFGARFSGSRGTVSPEKLLDNAFEMMNIDASGFVRFDARPLSLLDSLEQLQATHHKGLIDPGYRAYLGQQIAQWPVDLEEAVSILVQALTEASLLRSKALQQLTPEESARLLESLKLLTTDSTFPDGNMFLTGVDDTWSECLNLLSKVDFSLFFLSSSIMCDAVEMTRSRLKAAQSRMPISETRLLLDFRSAVGQITVGGQGIDFHGINSALVVDLGGNDIYRWNNPVNGAAGAGLSCIIDMAGNDVYECRHPGYIGGSILGIGLLIDYDGNDDYRSGPVSQGAVIGGVGFLYDESGNDSFIADVFCQGAAAFGIGLAVDVDGDDTLICRSIGQGFGTTLGLGAFVNVAGDDTYVAGPDFSADDRTERPPAILSQGAAAGFRAPDKNTRISHFGGIGFLVDRKGNDQYLGGNFCQGAARFASMGLLLDSEGHDIYQAGNFSQGAAVEWSAAALVDQSGNDVYAGGDSVQAVAVNNAGAILLDYSGDDRYGFSGQHGQGHSREPFSFSLLIDYRGFDSYSGGPFARGSVVNAYAEAGHVLGIFIDHRGKDVYPAHDDDRDGDKGPGDNNSEWSRNSGELGIDTPVEPAMYFVNEQAGSRQQHYDMNPVVDLEPGDKLSRLGSGDPFSSLFALSGVIARGQNAVSSIVKAMHRGHDSFRRTMEEALGYFILLEFDGSQLEKQLGPLLNNLDPGTRQWCLIQLERRRTPSTGHLIAAQLHDADPAVRSTAARILGNLDETTAENDLLQAAVNDPDPMCRQAALKALSCINPTEHLWAFRTALADPYLPIHWTARNHLIELNDHIAIGSLQLLTTNPNPQIRYSASTALIQLGDKSGFPVLIDVLDKIHRKRSPHDSMQPVSDFLGEYSGQNLDPDEMSLKRWWTEHGQEFDLAGSILARSDYLTLFDSIIELSPRQLLEAIDRLRTKHPQYSGIDRRLAPYVRAAAGKALMDGALDPAERLVDYAVEMNPGDAESWGLKSQVLYKKDDLEGAVAALTEASRIDPENSHYRKLQDVYDSIRQAPTEQQEGP